MVNQINQIKQINQMSTHLFDLIALHNLHDLIVISKTKNKLNDFFYFQKSNVNQVI